MFKCLLALQLHSTVIETKQKNISKVWQGRLAQLKVWCMESNRESGADPAASYLHGAQ